MITQIRRARENRRRAFTLLEVLIVVAIIAVLAGTGVWYGFRYLEDSKKSAARIKATNIGNKCSAFRTKYGNNPGSLQELLQPPDGGEPYVDPQELRDPWGNMLQYNPEGPHNNRMRPDVWATAPDGEQCGNWDLK